jgi:hypothetical protein
MHADDEQVLAKFMSAEPGKRLTLADMVMDRIKEKETEIQSMVSGMRRYQARSLRNAWGIYTS